MNMLSRQAVIRLAMEGLSATRAHRWLPKAPDAAGLIVTLHHVRPEGGESEFRPNALLSVTPDFLDSFLAHVRTQGWRFVSLDEMLAEREKPEPHRIAITLDDGYRNNREHAWPVFQRHRAPFTIFVCPGFCDRTAELWWEALERIIASTDEIDAPGDASGALLPTRSSSEKRRAFRLWMHWLTTDADEQQQRVIIRELAAKHDLDLALLAAELVMDWDEVRSMVTDPLCTIGAHTMTHPALARLPAQDAVRQMSESADRIAAEIGVRPKSIAFPYGYPEAASAREARLAAEAGFDASFTTQPGYVPRTRSLHGLGRVSLNGLYQHLKYADVLLTPGLWKIRDRMLGN